MYKWREWLRKKGLLWAAVVCLIAAGIAGWRYYQEYSKPKQTLPTAKVEIQDIVSTVAATGTIKALNSVDVSSKITGLITEVKVQENDHVTAGQVLLTLDGRSLQAQLEQARARHSNAMANYERNRALFTGGAISAQQLDASRMDYEVAQTAYENAQAQLDDTIIRAPLAGVVIGKPIPAGQTVAPGISTPMVLMTVADMSQMQIEVQVDESDISRVREGQEVAFSVDAYPNREFAGRVVRVSQKATIQQNVVYYLVTVDVEAPEGLLKPTMTARVSVRVGERLQVPTVPLGAVRDEGNRSYVQVLRNGAAEKVQVRTGMSSEDRVEIVEGVVPGEEVVLPKAATAAADPSRLLRRAVR